MPFGRLPGGWYWILCWLSYWTTDLMQKTPALGTFWGYFLLGAFLQCSMVIFSIGCKLKIVLRQRMLRGMSHTLSSNEIHLCLSAFDAQYSIEQRRRRQFLSQKSPKFDSSSLKVPNLLDSSRRRQRLIENTPSIGSFRASNPSEMAEKQVKIERKWNAKTSNESITALRLFYNGLCMILMPTLMCVIYRIVQHY